MASVHARTFRSLVLASALWVLACAADYYAVLGVSKDADAKDIKSAYRKMALKWHPDKNPDDRQNAEAKFREVAEAYEVLSDPDRKRRYDQGGDPHQAGHGGGGGGFDFGDFGFGGFKDPKDLFKEMFGNEDPFADFSKFFDDIKIEDFGADFAPGDEAKASQRVSDALSTFYRAMGHANHEAKAKELLGMPKWQGKESKLARVLRKKYADQANGREFKDFEAAVEELDRNRGGGSGGDPFAGFGDIGGFDPFAGFGDLGKAFGMGGGFGGMGGAFGGFPEGASTTMSFSSFSSTSGGKTVKKETRVQGGKRVTKTIESDESGTRAMLEEEQGGRIKRQTGVRHKDQEQLAQGSEEL